LSQLAPRSIKSCASPRGYRKGLKIFGIGLSKTGTHSLTEALNVLGFKAAHWEHTKTIITYVDARPVINPNSLENHDAFTDTPVSRVYRELDVMYPGSKFILTVREMNGWLRSIERHLSLPKAGKDSAITEQLRIDLYGSVEFDEQLFRKSYDTHVKKVLSYFRDNKQDLLIINICGGEGWETLCPFLRMHVPDRQFPKANVAPKANRLKRD